MNFIITILVALVLSLSHAQGQKIVKVGVYDNYPKIFFDSENNPKGLFVDIMNQIAKNHGWKVQYIPVNWPEAFDKLDRGDIDIMPDVAYTKDRTELVSFNNITVLSSWLEVFSLEKNAINTVADFQNKKLGVLSHSTQEKFAKNFLDQWKMDTQLVPYKTYQEVEQALVTGAIDFMIADRFYEYALVNKNGISRIIHPTGIVFFPSTLHFATKKGSNLKILETIDSELSKAINDPSSFYYQSISHWLSQSPQVIVSKKLIRWIIIISSFLLLSLIITILLYRKLRIRQHELTETIQLLKKSQEEIINSEKMKLLGVFTAGITHDLNNIFMPIIGNIQLLDLDSAHDRPHAQVSKALERIKKAAEDGVKMIEKIKLFYKGQDKEEKFVDIELAKELPEIIDFLAPMIKNSKQDQFKHISFEYDIEGHIFIKMKVSDLREIINNIILNAVDAIDKNGIIKVTATKVDCKVEIKINDNGKGMPPEVREHCFDLLFTTKGAIGTGMGLPSVKKIIESYRGDITVESEAGVGTTFKITFEIT